MDAEKAKKVLALLELRNIDPQTAEYGLKNLNIKAFGNKGRLWSKEGCIVNLDKFGGICNPRLSHNYCDVLDIGCPVCLRKLRSLIPESDLPVNELVIHKLEVLRDKYRSNLGGCNPSDLVDSLDELIIQVKHNEVPAYA